MSTHRQIGPICCAALALTLAVTVLFMSGAPGLQAAAAPLGYEERLFDTGRVHTIEIVMDGWEDFLASCEDEEYVSCSLVIDGEALKNAALRAKGNTSLSMVRSYGNSRYSFKIEFDHYEAGRTYHGLDKLSLNNLIQDNTFLKDFLTYQLMGQFGAAAPLCSFVFLTVNGEDWGLYLAVEGVEESFLQRNYGSDFGQLYKPDTADMGGRGTGGAFHSEEQLFRDRGEDRTGPRQDGSRPEQADRQPPSQPDSGGEPPERPGGRPEGEGAVKGSGDVSLIYSDDSFDSYANIFDSAKTSPTDGDKARLIAALKTLNTGQDPSRAVDAESVIRYFVVHNFVCNFDSYTGSIIHNYYLYEKDGVLSMIPWDYNLAFGGFQSQTDAAGLVNFPIDTPVSGGSVEDRPMLAWIFASEEYTALYHQYFQEFLSVFFDSGRFLDLLDQTAELIAPYVRRDPTKFCTEEEFQAGVSTLRQFCLLRAESVSGQLSGTIPSTDEGQRADPSSLIDASDLTISHMGSMNPGGAGGFPGSPAGPGFRETAAGGQEDFSGGQPPSQRPEGEPSPPQSGGGLQAPALLLACAAVLLLGLAAAAKWKH